MKDLVDSVAAATGGKKPEVKNMVEATLAALGEAFAGEGLVVPPLGQAARRQVQGLGATDLKLRLADGARSAAGLALAETARIAKSRPHRTGSGD